MKAIHHPQNAPKRAFPLGRWPIIAGVLCGALLLSSAQAHAAHWEVTWRPDGTASPNGGEWINNYSPDPVTGRINSYGNPVEFYNGFGNNPTAIWGSSDSKWSATQASQEGSVTVHLEWKQDMYDDPPVPAPEMVVLHISGNATAGARNLTSQSTVESTFGKIEGTHTSACGCLRIGKAIRMDLMDM